jgi:ribosome-binding factor A
VKKRSSHRPEQVAETIRQVVAEALAQDVRDPRVERVTVIGVRVTGDLGHARVSVVLGEGVEAERAMEGPHERRRVSSRSGRSRALHPHRTRARVRAGSRGRACPADE